MCLVGGGCGCDCVGCVVEGVVDYGVLDFVVFGGCCGEVGFVGGDGVIEGLWGVVVIVEVDGCCVLFCCGEGVVDLLY